MRAFDNSLDGAGRTSGARLSKTLAAWTVIALWLPYAALNTIFPGPQLTYALGLTLAALGLALLRLAGVPLYDRAIVYAAAQHALFLALL